MKSKNRGAVQLEYILLVVSVVFVALGSMKLYGGKISNIWTDTSNAIGSIEIGNSEGSGGSSGSGSKTYIMLDAPETVQKTDVSASFRSEAEYSKFLFVNLDDSRISESQYDLSEGSTIVTLKKEVIRTLMPGTHTLEIVSNDGSAITCFTILEPTIDISNINTADVQGNFSAKGNIVTINNSQYRVLSIDGTQAKVYSIDSQGSAFYGSSKTYFPNGTQALKYENSGLDNKMNAYYESLPTALQNAIVEQEIKQSLYDWHYTSGLNPDADFSAWTTNPFTEETTEGDEYWVNKIDEITVGLRKVYALDVDDIIEYLGHNSTPQDINEMMHNTRTDISRKNVWLRSSTTWNSTYGMYVNSAGGRLANNTGTVSQYYEAHPVFVIDLSLLS